MSFGMSAGTRFGVDFEDCRAPVEGKRAKWQPVDVLDWDWEVACEY